MVAGDPGERHALRAGAGQPARQRVQPHRAAHGRAPPQRAGRGARQVTPRPFPPPHTHITQFFIFKRDLVQRDYR